ncbi:tigger transposable element-derived protein 6-like [Ornithodoros turicata]|uniref:tigger transposable element-derived protein 6-like n=1 Tax=Ornithodoros turicata TaxID=34597 RepID=UPI0031394292
MSRKRKALPFKDKLEILSKRKRADLAKELGIPQSALSTIVGQRDGILKNVQQFGINVKQAKPAQHVKLEEVLLAWFKEVTAAGINVDGKVLREKADEIALSLGVENFLVSTGWLRRFKARHRLVYKSVCGEGKKVDEDVVSEWMTSTLPTLHAGYEPRDVFNADEAGLFFNVQPGKSLCFKGQNCQGGEKSKQRVTVLFCCNADGSEKMKLTVIRRSLKPRCFKHAGRLPCLYKANKKAWMTGSLFEEFLPYLDRKMACSNRKIVLIIDQCSAHPKQDELQKVKVLFLPPNATSHLQPLDAGIIRNVRHHFKELLMRRLLAKIDRKDQHLQINLLDALHFVAMSWDRVTATTMQNCFRKCGFFNQTAPSADADVDATEDDLAIENWDHLGVEVSAHDFVTVDDDLATCGLRSIDKIVSEGGPQASGSCSEEDTADEHPPTTAETLDALDVLRRVVDSEGMSEDACERFYAFQRTLLKHIEGTKKQLPITDFFCCK